MNTPKEHLEQALREGVTPREIVMLELMAEQTDSSFVKMKERWQEIKKWFDQELYGVKG